MRQSFISSEKEVISQVNEFVIRFLSNKTNKVIIDHHSNEASFIEQELNKLIANLMFNDTEDWPMGIETSLKVEMAWMAYATNAQFMLLPIQAFINLTSQNKKAWNELDANDIQSFVNFLEAPDNYLLEYRVLIKAFNIAIICSRSIHHWLSTLDKELVTPAHMITILNGHFRQCPLFSNIDEMMALEHACITLSLHPLMIKTLADKLSFSI